MAKVWQSSDVTAGADITHTQYNNLRLDVIDAHKTSAPIGSIIMWAGSDANVPDGWALCNGSAISRATYADLYTLTGNTFGAGDGSTTFNLPDMRDRFVVGAGSTYSRNGKGGAVSNTISTAQLPNHRHSVSINSQNNHRAHTHGPASTDSGASNFLRGFATDTSGNRIQETVTTPWLRIKSDSTTGVNSVTHYHLVSGNTGYLGSGSAVENRPPYIGLFYIIRVIND